MSNDLEDIHSSIKMEKLYVLIISGLFVVTVAIFGWSVSNTLSSIRDDLLRIEKNQERYTVTLTNHLIENPENKLMSKLEVIESRLSNLEISK